MLYPWWSSPSDVPCMFECPLAIWLQSHSHTPISLPQPEKDVKNIFLTYHIYLNIRWLPFIQNLQFWGKYLYRICLALCVTIRDLPTEVWKEFSHSVQVNMVYPKQEILKDMQILWMWNKQGIPQFSNLHVIHNIIQMTNTWLISLKSWLTSTMPPSKSLIASASASIVSMSKWFVGSSSSNRWGACQARYANTTRHRCPSLSCRIGHT